MTPQPQQPNPNELLSITREELERCCSQMSAAGYKVSANYVEASVLSRSRPAPQQPALEEIRKFLAAIQSADCPAGREMNDDICTKYGFEGDPCLVCKFDAAVKSCHNAAHHPPTAADAVLEELDHRCEIAAREYAPDPDKGEWASDSHRDPFNEVREWIAALRAREVQQG